MTLVRPLALLVVLAAMVAKGDTKPVDNSITDETDGYSSVLTNLASAMASTLAGGASSDNSGTDQSVALFKTMFGTLLGSGKSQNDDTSNDQTTTLNTILGMLLSSAKSTLVDGTGNDGSDQTAATLKSVLGGFLGAAKTSLTGEDTDVDLTAKIPINAVMTDPKGVFKAISANFKTAVAARGGEGSLVILDSFLQAIDSFCDFLINMLTV